jgi:hypothetical protein
LWLTGKCEITVPEYLAVRRRLSLTNARRNGLTLTLMKGDELIAQVAQGQLLGAQAQPGCPGVPRVVEEQRRILPLPLPLTELHFQSSKLVQELFATGILQNANAVLGISPELDEEVGKPSGIGSGVVQRILTRAAISASDDQSKCGRQRFALGSAGENHDRHGPRRKECHSYEPWASEPTSLNTPSAPIGNSSPMQV